MSSNIRKQFQRVAQRLDQGLGRYVDVYVGVARLLGAWAISQLMLVS